MKKIIYLALLGLMIFPSCKKSKSTEPTDFNLLQDSVFLYVKEAYLWNDAIPEYGTFNPRAYISTDQLYSLQIELDALSQMKINPATSQPYEYYTPSPGEAKYSFIDQGQTATQLNGSRTDFGLAFSYYLSATDLRIRFVYPGSPGGLANIRRGDQITKLNGRTALDGSVTADYNFIVSALNGATITMTLKRSDGTTYDASVTQATYTSNPVLATKIFDQGGGKKVGYMVFNTFTSPANAKSRLDDAFATFTSSGVTDLVIDLRYNGGGYVSTAEYLSNLIAPSAKTGTVMYNTYYNSTLASGKASLLKKQVRRDPATGSLYNYGSLDFTVAGNAVKFNKAGGLNAPRVFFIVGSSTASASELVINNLRPHVAVQLIGSTTYGKPVGFFDINIGPYTMYAAEFETKNSADQGGYYTGMTPGTANYPGLYDADDLSKDFGDPAEGLLKHALDYVKNGNYSASQLKVQSAETTPANAALAQQLNKRLDEKLFKGMILDKKVKH